MSVVTQIDRKHGCVRVWLLRYSKMIQLYEWRP